jgi:hypothetical protein
MSRRHLKARGLPLFGRRAAGPEVSPSGPLAYRSGRSPDWLKMKNPDAPAVKREAEEDWGMRRK